MADKNYTNVDTGGFIGAVRIIKSSIAQIGQVRDALNAQVVSGLEPYWQGEAKEMFVGQFNQFAEAFAKYADGYKALTDELDRATAAYERADADVMSVINGLPR